MMRWVVLLFAAIVVAPGCSAAKDEGTKDAPLTVPDGCQPLLVEPGDAPSTGVCLAPYPSDFHRTADAKSLTGFRLGLNGAARPKKPNGEEADPHDVVA